MFGHHDDDESAQQDEGTVSPQNQPVNAPAGQTAAPSPVDDTPASSFNEPTQSAPPVTEANPSTPPTDTWQHPGKPLSDKDQIKDIISPAGGFPKRPTYQYPQGAPQPQDDSGDSPVTPANPELIDIREHALEELEPLLEKLNLPPEEKFRAIMMILQAKDDQSLVKAAYEAAHSIEDEETKARALYDIVNEVNYFTNPPAPEDTEA